MTGWLVTRGVAGKRYSGTDSLLPSARFTTTFNARALHACPSGGLGENAVPISDRDRSNAIADDLDINAIHLVLGCKYFQIQFRFCNLSAKDCKDARAIPTNEQIRRTPLSGFGARSGLNE